ncbi:HAD family hydrolase [Bacillus sp. 03113]|uniref:HAD family hydrolase n=1 Tax=Bacillus sp. 03113 TaxID=2578211 RepID=UPI00114196E0|nr:HAD family hydrolase [Bacillus sp. 03113]
MNKQYEMVADFQRKMGQPVADKPTVMKWDRRSDRYHYMEEELIEFFESDELVDQSDAMIDLIYLAIGTLVEIGVKPEALFEIVHNANMSKLWPDGKPRTNPETGKIIKPPTFVRPEPLLQAEIERQASVKTPRKESRKLSDYHTETTVYLDESEAE